MKNVVRISLLTFSSLFFSSAALAVTDAKLCRLILQVEKDAALWAVTEADRTNRSLGFNTETETIQRNDGIMKELALELEEAVIPHASPARENFINGVNRPFNYETAVGRAKATTLVKDLLTDVPEVKSSSAGNSDLEQNYYRMVEAPFQGASEIFREISAHYRQQTRIFSDLEDWAKMILVKNEATLESQINSTKKLKRGVLKTLIKSYDCTSNVCTQKLERLRADLETGERRVNRLFIKYQAFDIMISQFIQILRHPSTEVERQLAAQFLAMTEKQYEVFTAEFQKITWFIAQNEVDIARLRNSAVIASLIEKRVLVEIYLDEAEPSFLKKLAAQIKSRF